MISVTQFLLFSRLFSLSVQYFQLSEKVIKKKVAIMKMPLDIEK